MLLCAGIINSKVANMQELKTLIDKAAKVCGSDKALAEKLGVHPPTLSAMRKGRTITPETAAELADIAGESVKMAVYQAMIERNKGTRREGVLREILGKSLLAGVAAMSLFSYAPDVKAAMIYNEKVSNLANLIYIVEYVIQLFATLHKRLLTILASTPKATNQSMTRQTMFSRNFAGPCTGTRNAALST